jgi:hypothetical protein
MGCGQAAHPAVAVDKLPVATMATAMSFNINEHEGVRQHRQRDTHVNDIVMGCSRHDASDPCSPWHNRVATDRPELI